MNGSVNVYVIDTSALIDIKRTYPLKRIPPIWRWLESLIKEGRLTAPQEVFNEISRYTDDLKEWGEKNPDLFVKLDLTQIMKVREVMTKHPQLFDPEKPVPDADPYVIGLALERRGQRTVEMKTMNTIVISHEGSKKSHIPDVCKAYTIRCIRFEELMELEDWKFG